MSDDIVAAVRERLQTEGRLPADDRLSNEARQAFGIAAEWERRVEQLAVQARCDQSARNFRRRWPALARWRDRTLANGRHSRRCDVAAAYELVALECYLGGVPDLADKAQSEAMRVLMTRTDHRDQPGAKSRSGAAVEARSA